MSRRPARPELLLPAPRARLSFRAVNRKDSPDYNPGLQRHHLLPRQLLGRRCFGNLFDAVGTERIGFDDFRSNGLLLPASDTAVVRMGLPLHRGPHRDYNEMVIERVGQVEAGWSALRNRAPEVALDNALMRLELLQRALRRRLLDPMRRLTLNRHDPLGQDADFADLDAMAEALWGASEPWGPDPGRSRTQHPAPEEPDARSQPPALLSLSPRCAEEPLLPAGRAAGLSARHRR